MRDKGGGADHSLESRVSLRALFSGEPDAGHAGAKDRGRAGTGYRENPEGHAGVCPGRARKSFMIG